MSVSLSERYEKLPVWLKKEFSAPKERNVVGYDYSEDIFWVKNVDNDSISYFPTFEEAIAEDKNVKVDNSVNSIHHVVKNCVVDKNCSKLLLVDNEDKTLERVCDAWEMWSKLEDKLASQKTLTGAEAYAYIAYMPLYWFQPSSFGEKIDTWVVDGGHSHLSQFFDQGFLYFYVTTPRDVEELFIVIDSIDDMYLSIAQFLHREWHS